MQLSSGCKEKCAISDVLDPPISITCLLLSTTHCAPDFGIGCKEETATLSHSALVLGEEGFPLFTFVWDYPYRALYSYLPEVTSVLFPSQDHQMDEVQRQKLA